MLCFSSWWRSFIKIRKEGEVFRQVTGDLKNHLDVLKENNIKFYVSDMSAKRDYDESLLKGFNAEFTKPDKLIDISSNSETIKCH